MIPKFRIYCYETQEMIVARDYRELAELFTGLDADDSLYGDLMQSTGLLDKNGKEIFEGDVVFDKWANAYTPVFQNGIYMAYNPKNLMQNDPSTQFNVIWRDGCEIIGNIYQNPELVEEL
ncbi:TPA: YopX family protein [Streptococcus suis]